MSAYSRHSDLPRLTGWLCVCCWLLTWYAMVSMTASMGIQYSR